LVSHIKERHKLRIEENKVLRRIFGLQREEVVRKLHNEELHNLNTIPNIMRVIKSRMMR
jgi:hypothetical protein